MSPSPFEPAPVRITVRPPQFGLRTLLVAATAVGLIFGVLGWFEVSVAVGFFALAILLLAGLATAGLVAALLQAYTIVETPHQARTRKDEAFDPFRQPTEAPSAQSPKA